MARFGVVPSLLSWNNSRIRLALVFATITILFRMPSFLVAQTATGFPPFGSFQSGVFDSVDLENLNVHFGIPIVSKTGRGVPFNFTIGYDSSVWYVGSAQWQPIASWGWSTQGPIGYASYNVGPRLPCNDGSGDYAKLFSGYQYTDQDGTSHSFSNIQFYAPPCFGGGQYSATADDGSGYTMYSGGTVIPPSGGSIVSFRQACVTTANSPCYVH